MEASNNGTDPFDQLLQAAANVLAQLEKQQTAAQAKAETLGGQIPRVRRALAVLRGDKTVGSTRGRKRSISQETRDYVASKVLAGANVADIAAEVGIAHSTAVKIVRELKVRAAV